MDSGDVARSCPHYCSLVFAVLVGLFGGVVKEKVN